MVTERDICTLGSMGPDFQQQFVLRWLVFVTPVADLGVRRYFCLCATYTVAAQMNPKCKLVQAGGSVMNWYLTHVLTSES